MACGTPYYVVNNGEEIPVPCGRCYDCKNRKVREWAFRLLEEDKVSTYAHFVTLTYNTHHVPLIKGNSHPMTLDPKDLTNYFKRLRKNITNHVNSITENLREPKIKYYAVGEYGTKSGRPHYHFICFNNPFPDLFVDSWRLNNQPIGTVYIGDVKQESILYTLKYISKPGKVPIHANDKRVPEFSRTSNGIGLSYIAKGTKRITRIDPNTGQKYQETEIILKPEIKRWHTDDLSRNYVYQGKFKVPLSRYYREKLLTPAQQEQQRYLAEQASSEKYLDLSRKIDRLYKGRVTMAQYLASVRARKRTKLKKEFNFKQPKI